MIVGTVGECRSQKSEMTIFRGMRHCTFNKAAGSSGRTPGSRTQSRPVLGQMAINGHRRPLGSKYFRSRTQCNLLAKKNVLHDVHFKIILIFVI